MMIGYLSALAQNAPTDFSPPFSPAPSVPTTPDLTLFNPLYLIAAVFLGFLAMAIWQHKGGSSVVGFLWGFFLGLIGVLVVVIARPSGTRKTGNIPAAQTQAWQEALQSQTPQRPCPHCGQGMPVDRANCPACQQISEPWRMQNGVWVTRNDNRDWWLDPQTNEWRLQRINKFCPSCRAEMRPQDHTCSECGAISNAIAPT
jgi:hypothetical protein